MIHTATTAARPDYLPGLEPQRQPDYMRITSSPEAWIREFSAALFASLKPRKYEPPDTWAEHSIYFSRPGDPVRGYLDLALSPFLRDPIRAWELHPGDGIREITVVAPEQMGKSLTWFCGSIWSSVYRPSTMLIYYTSDTKAKQVNETKFLPLISNVSALHPYLDLPNSTSASCIRLGPAQIYFGGVGARISSFTSAINIADELDDWTYKSGISPMEDLRKRARAFADGILCKVCTPKGTERQSRIWREFLRSSQGYWHLRCQGCGGLTIRSCDIHHLKFELGEKTDAGIHALPLPDSIRLVCPVCHHEHTEERDRANLVRQGAYVHKYPDRTNNLGFQWGYLANLFPAGSWYNIAKAQANAGSSSDEESQRTFDNSFRGLPFKFRRLDSSADRALRIHQAPLPDPATIRWRFFAADTQEDCFYYVVRGMDLHRNTWLLDCGRLATVDELRSAILGQYCGGPVLAGIIDEGGHRQDEVRQLANTLANVYTYKGNTSIRARWKVSSDYSRLLLGHAEHWRVALLQKIYAAAQTAENYWYTTEVMDDTYIRHLSAYRRPSSGKLADELSNGDVSCYKKADGADDHLFDAEKMALMLMDYTWHTAIRPYLERKVRTAPHKPAGGAA